MLQLLKDLNLPLRETVYISCDHPLFSGISLFEFLEEFSKKGGKIVLIDEIHKAPEFQAHLKSSYDFLDIKIFFQDLQQYRLLILILHVDFLCLNFQYSH